MAEHISIDFVRREVGIQYHPETSEATFQDEMIAREMALQVLAAQAIQHRQQRGIPVPATLVAIVDAHTFHDLL